MINTQRNTLVLTALLVLLGGSGFMVFRSMNQKAQELLSSNQDSSKKIAVLEKQISNIDSLKMEYEIRKAMVAEQSKVVLSTDSPTLTYQYLIRMLSWMKRDIIFDFALSDKGTSEAAWNEYVLSGKANFRDVLELTKNIEHQRAVLTIEDYSLSSDGVVNSDTVSFSMIVRTHFDESGIVSDELNPKQVPATTGFYQLFKSRIYEAMPANLDIDPRLTLIDQATLIGIASNRIFLRDNQGVIKILSLRDRVAYGYLYKIDPKQGKATFVIDKYGIPEEQSLFINNTN